MYPIPSLEEFTSTLVTLWKSYFPLSNVGSRFSYHWKRLRAYAGGVTDNHAALQSAMNDVMPDTATGAFLTRWGGIVGVGKKGASGARRSSALRVTGIPGSTPKVGDQLLHESTGFTFQLTTGTTLGNNGQADLDVQAISTGAATRLLAGETLKFIAPQPGVQQNAKLVLDLNEGGFDAEQEPAYSVRVNDELAKPRMGGSQDDFVKWLLAYQGAFQIAAAYCYPGRAGNGTVDLAAFKAGDGSARSLTAAERAALLAWLKNPPDDVKAKIFSGMPAQLTGGAARILATAADLQNVEILIQTNGDNSYAFDWTDSTPPVVSGYDPATRQLSFVLDRPGDMAVGHRLCLKGVGSVQTGAPITIEQLVSTNAVILKATEAPSVAPAATDIVYAGGPLTKQIRDAIVAHMNGEIVYGYRGVPVPASRATSAVLAAQAGILSYGIGPSNPTGGTFGDGLYGQWNGKLLIAELTKLAGYSTGVRNVSIATPVADYAPAETVFPNDGTVNFVAPRLVLVRKSWA